MIPIARPLITPEEMSNVQKVLASGALTSGQWVERFEREFADYVGARYAIATSSGTTALEVGLEAAQIGPGDEVIVPPFTFIATSNAVLHRGARPVFVDVDPETYNLDPNQVEDALRANPRVRAILAVHLYGLPARVDLFAEMAARYGVILIEDAAQSHGAALDGRRVGTFGHLSMFSFYPTKNITTGEGGMVMTSDPELARRARLLVHVGVDGGPYNYAMIGYNFRMTNIAAAIGVGQLARLDALNGQRRRNAAALTSMLEGAPGIQTPVTPPGAFHVYNQYTIRSTDRDGLARHLAARDIGSKVYYPTPLPATPPYQALGFGDSGTWPVTERACREVLSIPVHPALSDDDVRRVGDAVRDFTLTRVPREAAT
jgi:dTDP-4-amino-4,6-dideoxygalactose transaminase